MRDLLAGLAALACLAALSFALLRWRMDTPEQHLNFGNVVVEQPGQGHE